MVQLKDGAIALGILVIAVLVIVGLNRYSSKWRVQGYPDSTAQLMGGGMPSPVMEHYENENENDDEEDMDDEDFENYEDDSHEKKKKSKKMHKRNTHQNKNMRKSEYFENHNKKMNKDSHENFSNMVIGQDKNTEYSQDPALQQLRNASCFPKSTLSPEELLPQDNASLWAQTNPNGDGSLRDRNLLQSGALIGINTVGQTLKNPNLGLRSEPPNPKVPVSPWINSSFEPDLNRKPFELGGCA